MAIKSKRTHPKTIDTRLTALRTDFDSLQEDVKGLAGDVGDAANARVHGTIRSAENVAGRALRLAEETAAEANKRAEQLVDDTEAWANDNLDSVRGSVRAQPMRSMLLSIGAGALIGAFFARR